MSDSMKGMPLQVCHFDDDGNAVAGTGRKEGIKPYVRFDLSEISGVPTSGLPTWILLLRQWTATKKDWVTIPKRIRDTAGVSQRNIARGLTKLEDAGFVELQKCSGHSTRVLRKEVIYH